MPRAPKAGMSFLRPVRLNSISSLPFATTPLQKPVRYGKRDVVQNPPNCTGASPILPPLKEATTKSAKPSKQSSLTFASGSTPLSPKKTDAMTFTVSQKLAAEAFGTALLLAIVVGSGIMGEALADGNDAIALLGNTIATGAGLAVLILIFGPVSGAHFNPAVTVAFLLRGDIALKLSALYIITQIISGLAGVALAHAMFDLEIMQQSIKARAGTGQAIGEAVATFGLVLTILWLRTVST